MSYVYKHTFPNGEVYIGKTRLRPEDRWLNGWGYKNCPLMFNAILYYGWSNVKHEIIADNLTDEEANALERKEIVLHSAFSTDGLHSESAQSPTMIYNIQHIPAQYLAQENAHYITQNSPAQKVYQPQRKIEEAHKEHYKEYIIPLTPRPVGIHICAVDVYTEDGIFICTYPSIKIAAQELGVNEGDAVYCCKGIKPDGKRKYQAGGYIFRYHTEKEVG